MRRFSRDADSARALLQGRRMIIDTNRMTEEDARALEQAQSLIEMRARLERFDRRSALVAMAGAVLVATLIAIVGPCFVS